MNKIIEKNNKKYLRIETTKDYDLSGSLDLEGTKINKLDIKKHKLYKKCIF